MTTYAEVSRRIRTELPELDRAAGRALRSWDQVVRAVPDADVYLDSVALNLHSFYSGLERLFELIARHIDRELPGGDAWHRTLLLQMAQDRPPQRPAVISAESREALDEVRRFRHLVRNVYTANLHPSRMTGLLEELPVLWSRLLVELSAFASLLEQMADPDR